MKKIVISSVICVLTTAVFAQDKKVNVGLAYQIGMSFIKAGTNKISPKVGFNNSIGFNMNINFNDNIGMNTGLEFDFESNKYEFEKLNGENYYYFKDKDIIKKEDLGSNADASLFSVNERKYKNIFLSIPTMLIFRTNSIGDWRYYGKFGARTGFLIKSTMEDDGLTYATNNISLVADENQSVSSTSSANTAMKVPYGNDVVVIRSALGLGGGAQWNFTGNTILFADLSFYYGLTPMHVSRDKKDDNMTLFNRSTDNTTNNYFRFKANQMQLCLKIGILF
ncbi:MAG TPA: outer membrane beta-barrel protein [Fluviicola sp.]|nr:outer membrane beta-barrel protein [Fluviicola sp.]